MCLLRCARAVLCFWNVTAVARKDQGRVHTGSPWDRALGRDASGIYDKLLLSDDLVRPTAGSCEIFQQVQTYGIRPSIQTLDRKWRRSVLAKGRRIDTLSEVGQQWNIGFRGCGVVPTAETEIQTAGLRMLGLRNVD